MSEGCIIRAVADGQGAVLPAGTAVAEGAGAREHYERHFSAGRAAVAWSEVFARVAQAHPSGAEFYWTL